MKFVVLNGLPDEFFTTHPTQLYKIFAGPTLVHLDFGHEQTIFISIMLHGNEHSGYYAIRDFLSSYKLSQKSPSKNISLLIGNVLAAKESARYLDGQKDFNRIWSDGDSEEERWAQKIYQEMASKNLFATVDLHNNTGKNPEYSAISNLESNTLRLASLFDGDILYFTDPKEVFTNYFSTLSPTLTVEAGRSGEEKGIQKIIELLTKIFDLESFEELGLKETILKNKKIFESFGKIKIPQNASISFDGHMADFIFDPNIENLNFNQILPGKIFGKSNNIDQHLLVFDSSNQLIGNSFFKYVGNEIITIEPFFPAMITTNAKIVHQDCLCYLLKAIDP